MSVWFKSRLNPWYIWIPSNPNLYSTKIIMKMRWQTIASNVSMRTISPTAISLPKAYDCVAVYIAGRRTSLVVYGWWPQPPTKNIKAPRHWTLWPTKGLERGKCFHLLTSSYISYKLCRRALCYFRSLVRWISGCNYKNEIFNRVLLAGIFISFLW